MLLQHFFTPKIAHSSYLLSGSKTCAVIDPRRDVQIYLESAKQLGMKITHILETHLHADFISGHMDLAKLTGAKIYAPASANCQFEHVPLSEGDSFEIEDMKISVFETPGHTPEHISYVVVDTSRGEDPVGLFCGDTLFVGDVGRPDLFPGRAQELADKLYNSLFGKLLKLPDFCEVYPAHGAGSLCGRAMGAKWRSTIGYEKKYNSALQIKDREEFIKSLTTNMPPAPDHFSRCSAINGSGPAVVSDLPFMEYLEPDEFMRWSEAEDTFVLDVRVYDSFGGQHVPGAYHLDLGGNFPVFAGWVLPPDKKILLVAYDRAQAEEAVIWLRRVGLDHTIGYLDGGMHTWVKMGFPTDHVALLSVDEFYDMITGDTEFTLLDTRAPGEFKGSHIEGAVNIPVPDLRTRYGELNKELPIAIVCGSGHRSSLAASILEQHGYKNLLNVAGGMTGYNAAGYGPECHLCVLPHGPQDKNQ